MDSNAKSIPEVIKEKLSKEMDIADISLTDVSDGCGTSYSLRVVSDYFKGKRTLARHRAVNKIIKEEISKLHAFSVSTLTVDENRKELDNSEASEAQPTATNRDHSQ
ncbi:BolA-like protein [Coemansia sp. RSA 1085]|nr:BolA-like protein [Coemansia sp. RSA 1085]